MSDREALARELWWPHHESRTRDVALAELAAGSTGEVTMEFADVAAIVKAVADIAWAELEAMDSTLDWEWIRTAILAGGSNRAPVARSCQPLPPPPAYQMIAPSPEPISERKVNR